MQHAKFLVFRFVCFIASAWLSEIMYNYLILTDSILRYWTKAFCLALKRVNVLTFVNICS